MFKSILITSLLLSSVSLLAQDFDPTMEVSAVEITQIDVAPIETQIELPKIPMNPVDQVAMYVDGIIAIGKKVWPIIQAGMPVITTKGFSDSMSVLPAIENPTTHAELNQMANWSAPTAKSYRVSYKNYFNGEIASFVYTVMFQHGGTYKGVGKYITSLQVQASDVYAMYGIDFDASTELLNVANVGSEADPVASAMLKVSYKVRGRTGSQTFYVDGRGDLKVIQ